MGTSPLKFSVLKYHAKFVRGIFRKHSELFGWSNRQNWKIMDIGTGPGRALFEMEQFLPKDYEEIVCVDRDAKMCQYLNSLEKDRRISARQLDIETKMLPPDLKGRFDFLTSSYCLTFMVNSRQAFLNSNQLLKRGGELFFIWSKKNQIYEVYRTLSHTEKWAPYLKDFKNWKQQFDDENSAEALGKAFHEAGLEIMKIEEVNDEYFEHENSRIWIDGFDSMDFISARIPESELLEYREDYQRLTRRYIIEDKKANTAKVHFPTLVVSAKKF